MEGRDNLHTARVERKVKKIISEEKLFESEQKRKAAASELYDIPTDSEDDMDDLGEKEPDEDFTINIGGQKTKTASLTLTLPANISSHPEISACLDRIQLSHGKQVCCCQHWQKLEVLVKEMLLLASLRWNETDRRTGKLIPRR